MRRRERVARVAKRQFLYLLVSFGIGGGLTWFYSEQVFGFLLAPAQGVLSTTGRPVFTAPTEMFMAQLKLAFMGGVVATMPVITIGAFRLLLPHLGSNGRRFAIFFFPAVVLSAFVGTSFAYIVLLPTGLGFLLNFGTNIATPMIRISEYMEFVTSMMFWMGLLFELPGMMFLLSKFGLVSHKRFRRYGKFVPATMFVLAGIITPTFDIPTMLLVALPLIGLYWTGVFLAWLGRPAERERRINFIDALFLSLLLTVSAVVAGLTWRYMT